MQRGVLGAVCALVIGVYACTAHSGFVTSTSLNAADNYYNLLVQGFRAGQLSLKKEVPPGFAQLTDPYDRTANAPYALLDLSYYRGKFYLYFGVTPAVVLFWPYAALTGHYLSQKDAGLIFCAMGFLASVGLFCALWRRYFAEVSVAVVAAGTLALGWATFTPLLLARCDVHEVSVSCGYALTMLALAAIWKAVHEPERRAWWLAAASLAYGLGVGARPSLLFGALILLVPVAQAWRERRRIGAQLLAVTCPIMLIGLALMLYNARRFNNPFEFGMHYQLSGQRQVTLRFFSLDYLWFNFRVYFLEPARWVAHFPFVHDIAVPPRPVTYMQVETPFGILTNIPLVWLALVVPLAWQNRSEQAGSILRWFVTAVALLFGICASTVGLFWCASFRYEVDFLPALVLLAVIGILSWERALTPTSESGHARRPVWRQAVRWGWRVLLGFSVAFNLLASLEYCAEAHSNLAGALSLQAKLPEAIAHYEQALRLNPDYAEAHNDLGIALAKAGKIDDAIAHYEQALRIKPNDAKAHYNLGIALAQTGKTEEAIAHYEQVLRVKPDDAKAHYNLGTALTRVGKMSEAIAQYEQALRLNPNYAEAHNDLGIALYQTGQRDAAMNHYQKALQLKPDYAEAHSNYGVALQMLGMVPDAIEHYEQALRIDPDYAVAHCNLGIALAQLGRVPEAVGHWEQALRIKPDYAEVHYALGAALEQAGSVREAIGHYGQALRIKPDYAPARNALARLQTGQ
jgi:tetratricopeptide (TPR) repeat protein